MMSKKQRRGRKTSIEDIYQNKNFVPPKEKNLETIFEVPRKAKDGAAILTSVKKYRRYLHFDPTQGKIQKRKMKAKKCIKKNLSEARVTRSAPETFKCEDIMYKLDELEDSSNDSDITAKRAFRSRNEDADQNIAASHSKDVIVEEKPCCSSDMKSNDTSKKKRSLDNSQGDLATQDLSEKGDGTNNQENDEENSSPYSTCVIA